MHADAYDRARKLLGEHQGKVLAATVLGVVHSLLLVVLLVVLGLLAALFASQGEARYPADRVGTDLDRWVATRATGLDQDNTVFDDTGLLPVVTGNLRSTNPIHQAGARVIRRL